MMSEGVLMLQLFDAIAQQAGDPERLRVEYDLPNDSMPLISVQVALALDGARRALDGWIPRPPLDDAESGSLGEAIAEVVLARVREVMSGLIETRNHATMRSRSELLAWNRERQAVKNADRPSKEALAAMRDPKVSDDTMTRIDLGNGKFRFDYTVKPEGEVQNRR